MKYSFSSPIGKIVIQSVEGDGGHWESRLYKPDRTWQRSASYYDTAHDAALAVSRQQTGWTEWDQLPHVPPGLERLGTWKRYG